MKNNYKYIYVFCIHGTNGFRILKWRQTDEELGLNIFWHMLCLQSRKCIYEVYLYNIHKWT